MTDEKKILAFTEELAALTRKVDVMTLARISRHKDLKILLNTYYRETSEQIANAGNKRCEASD